MINIKRTADCVGCNACVLRCPKRCITVHEDEQGFLYPKVNYGECIDCGLCERVCPVINQYSSQSPVEVYAAWNTDDKIRMSSSSGGIFQALARKIIEDGGVVFGVKFDNKWNVVHTSTDKIEDVKAFQGSKYVQSNIGNAYKDAERYLVEGKKVLFSGTPCQIAGLKRFLRKDYEELLTVDVVCHGVPSPGLWRKYLKFLTRPEGTLKNTKLQSSSISLNDISFIKDISFRDKRLNWENFGIAIHYAAPNDGRNSESQSSIIEINKKDSVFFESHKENIFMQGFLRDLYLRPSCYECPVKCGKSHSDITLADFWGIKNHHPEFHSNKGVSLILVNSSKGIRFISDCPISIHKVSYIDALSGNRAIEKSATKPKQYNKFWQKYKRIGIRAIQETVYEMRPSIFQKNYILGLRIIRKIKRILFSKLL